MIYFTSFQNLCDSTISSTTHTDEEPDQSMNMFNFDLHNDPSSNNNGSIDNEPDSTVDDVEATYNLYNISVESDESTSPVEQFENKTKSKKKSNVWTEGETFKTFDEAHNFLSENGFGSRDVKYSSQGKKTYYACKAVSRRAQNKCDAQRIIFEPASETSFKILYTGTHTHDSFDEADLSKRMSTELINYIVSQRKIRVSADNIIQSIKELKSDMGLFPNDKIPDRKQIYYIASKRRLAEKPPIVSVGELNEWCEKHSAVPENEDEPFVFAFEHSNEDEGRFFRFAVSTNRLLKHCAKANLLCVDATYKVNWCGFPYLVIGTVDRAKKFHPLCFALCTSETEEDYAFVFNALTNSIKSLFNEDFSPKILIADGSFAIRNAFENSFTDILLMVMCYPHVLRNVRKRPLKNAKKNRAPIMHDINRMHLAPSEQIFNGMAALFLKKWAKEEKEFCDYFKDQWLGARQNWYEGASVYTPSHNNHVEGTNQAIKRDVTMRERLPMAEFTEAVLEMTRKISMNYAQNLRSFATEPNMPLALWRAGASWGFGNTPQEIISQSADEIVVQVISSKGMQSGLTLDQIKELKKKKWSDFDTFVSEAFQSYWTVTVSTRNWKLFSKCECPDFFKNHTCKHIIGVALRAKLFKCPPNAIPTPLGQKAKPGRKKKATKALLVQ